MLSYFIFIFLILIYFLYLIPIAHAIPLNSSNMDLISNIASEQIKQNAAIKTALWSSSSLAGICLSLLVKSFISESSFEINQDFYKSLNDSLNQFLFELERTQPAFVNIVNIAIQSHFDSLDSNIHYDYKSFKCVVFGLLYLALQIKVSITSDFVIDDSGTISISVEWVRSVTFYCINFATTIFQIQEWISQHFIPVNDQSDKLIWSFGSFILYFIYWFVRLSVEAILFYRKIKLSSFLSSDEDSTILFCPKNFFSVLFNWSKTRVDSLDNSFNSQSDMFIGFKHESSFNILLAFDNNVLLLVISSLFSVFYSNLNDIDFVRIYYVSYQFFNFLNCFLSVIFKFPLFWDNILTSVACLPILVNFLKSLFYGSLHITNKSFYLFSESPKKQNLLFKEQITAFGVSQNTQLPSLKEINNIYNSDFILENRDNLKLNVSQNFFNLGNNYNYSQFFKSSSSDSVNLYFLKNPKIIRYLSILSGSLLAFIKK